MIPPPSPAFSPFRSNCCAAAPFSPTATPAPWRPIWRDWSGSPLVWDEDELDWEAYQLCIDACESRGVQTIADLRCHTLPPEEYAVKWNGWCDAMQEVLALQRCAGK